MKQAKFDEAPGFTEAQIKYLNKLWPERCPDPKHTDREVWIAVGARQVVRHLNSVYESQLSNMMRKK